MTSILILCATLAGCGGGDYAAPDAGAVPLITATARAPATASGVAAASLAVATDVATAADTLQTADAAIAAPVVRATSAAVTPAADLAATQAAAWPFAPPPLTTLRASPKKVFAHYFTPFPVSIDNKAPESDYYAVNYLQPGGENGKFAGSGGFIKQRPLPRPVIAGADWARTDAAQDVRRAAALGIDGFAVDLLATSGTHWARAQQMMDVAASIDSGFKILLMPDMEAEFKAQPGNVLTAVRALAAHPAAHRLHDGRLVLAPYNAQNQSVAWWTNLLATLKAEGIEVAFFPVFQGWGRFAAAFAPISHGMSDWGDRSPGVNRAWQAAPAQAHGLGMQWMSTVSPQDTRAKDLIYWEARNSENYRVMWESAINGGADWVQIVTWNDYSESTEIAPSSGTQWSFYDLTAYYVAWFKTGVRPSVTRDALMYFHRNQATSAVLAANKQTRPYSPMRGSDAPADDIEVLVFATAPATVQVRVGRRLMGSQAVPSGVTPVRVPLAEGTPAFRLVRDNTTVAAVQSGFPICNTIIYQDLLYRGGSSLRDLVAPR